MLITSYAPKRCYKLCKSQITHMTWCLTKTIAHNITQPYLVLRSQLERLGPRGAASSQPVLVKVMGGRRVGWDVSRGIPKFVGFGTLQLLCRCRYYDRIGCSMWVKIGKSTWMYWNQRDLFILSTFFHKIRASSFDGQTLHSLDSEVRRTSAIALGRHGEARATSWYVDMSVKWPTALELRVAVRWPLPTQRPCARECWQIVQG